MKMSFSQYSFSAIHSDIIDTHILTKLDGLALASASCVSSELHALCHNENLWRNVCNTTWPSINHPLVRDTISTFPSGYRSFFSNSISALHSYNRRQCCPEPDTSELISAIDMRYKNKVVYSNIQVTNTLTDEFSYWPLCIHVLGPTENVAKFAVDEDEPVMPDLAGDLTLSWILIDPIRKLAANLSSLKPVLVEPHYLSGYKQMRFSTLVVAATDHSKSEIVEFRIAVTCGGAPGRGELVVKEVNLQVLDNDGMPLNGTDSLLVLQEAMDSHSSTGKRREAAGYTLYDEYLKMMTERREKREAKEARTTKVNIGDYACLLIIFAGLILWIFWHLFQRYILRRKNII